MATGDVKNNLRKLMAELKRINYPINEVNVKALSLGAPTAFLPILHYIFLDFSVDLTEFFAKDYELYGKTDLRFVETVYKIMRDLFEYKPHLTREQFLAIGFAERKIIQVCEILKCCREKCSKLNPKGSKMEKKQPCKLKAKSSVNEKKDKGKIPMKSCLKPSEAHSLQLKVIEEPSTRATTGKPILKTRKDDNKENRKQSKISSEEVEEKHNGNVENFSRLKSIKWDENGTSTISSSFNPTSNHNAHGSSLQQVTTTVTLPHPPKLIPAPVSMTTAPEPSPDLMLTPLTKTKHQAIPLSNSRNGATKVEQADISLVDLTDSTPLAQPKIVRHRTVNNRLPAQYNVVQNNPLISYSTDDNHIQQNIVRENTDCSSNVVSQDKELTSLKTLVTQMQEKLDSVLAMNNEMSARIVLLENKVKFLEEESKKNVCSCSRKDDLPNSRPVTMESTRPVTMETTRSTIFQSNYPTDRGEVLPVTMVTRPHEAACDTRYIHQGRTQTLSPSREYQSLTSRRHLFNDFNESQSTTVNDSVIHISTGQSGGSSSNEESSTPAVIEISDDDVDLGHHHGKASVVHSPERLQNVHEFDIISPLATKDIHLKFSDPTTTATILNVERRLKETREMLANATSKGISIT